MSDIYMETPTLKVVKSLKKTTAAGFKELKVGDTFTLRMLVKSMGCIYSHNVSYFSMNINNDKKIETMHSMNTIDKYLSCFELEIVNSGDSNG